MSVSKYNHEGYRDPTAYAALTHIEEEERRRMFRPLVYIASPYAGDVFTNEQNVRHYCRFVLDQGCLPIAPHLYFPGFMDDDAPQERELALHMGLVLLTKCSELWVFGDTVSKGMAREIRKAKYRGMPIRFFTDECKEVTHHV